MSWYLEFADYIERVSVWGLADHHSWISWGYPVLFDTNFHTKPAYYALLDALAQAHAPNISVPVITTSDIGGGNVGGHFAFQLRATQDNFAPMLWSIQDGALPPGLRLVSRTGTILGTPTQAGSFTFTVAAGNALGQSQQTFTVIIVE
ncbi:MAG: putative Ig domain-containing protein, partial [Defluviitaleaceae bacterium]|nr:putative Ig domain-containing protein [Defluviitaleaceae bacterium]